MIKTEFSENAAKIGRYVLIVAMLVTVAIMTYAAQPWGENKENQTLIDYVYLVAFSLWSIVPYLSLMIFIHLFRKHEFTYKVVNIGAGMIILVSLAFLIDTVFIHTDAQGALVFLFLPIYQWLALLLLGIISAIVFQLAKKNENR